MSAMMIEARTNEYATQPAFTESHPRGRGFRVLSRIARIQADDAELLGADMADYAPRHRLDVRPERALQALAV